MKHMGTSPSLIAIPDYPQVRTDNGPARKAGLHRRGQPTPVSLKDGTWWILSMDNDGNGILMVNIDDL